MRNLSYTISWVPGPEDLSELTDVIHDWQILHIMFRFHWACVSESKPVEERDQEMLIVSLLQPFG
jgi:hypothetical protein